jgi:hypothetical protein
MPGTPPPIPDPSKTAVAPPPPPAAQASGWSPAQLVRLESEWGRLRREFAFHPVIRVTPLAGDPPGEYRVDFTLRTLVQDAAGQLAYVDACAVEVALPPTFPHAGPIVRATGAGAIFHPNVGPDGIVYVTPPWNPAAGSLVDLVSRCGQLLAWQIYDPQAVANADAMAWAAHYPHLIPTDPNAVTTPDAGGQPMERIARAGPGALEQLRVQLTEMALGILEAGPGTDRTEVRNFGRRTSQALDAFAGPDAPADLRARAAELASWAQSMTPGRSIWDDLRSLCAHARTASTGAKGVRDALAKLDSAMREAEGLVQTEPVQGEPMQTLARLPAVSALDPAAIRVRAAARDVEQRAAALRVALEGLYGSPLAPVGTPGTLLHERATADVARASGEAAAARNAGAAALAEAEPLLARARLEQAALEGLVAWAQFTDLVRRGNEMTQRLVDLGAAGIQAYHIVTPAGQFGPYQFEERVDLVTARLVVRRIGAGPVEVYDARSMAPLGKGPGGVTVKVPDADGHPRDAEVRATEHTDELRVQLDYLIKTSREQVALLGKPGGSQAPSWSGRFVAALANFEATHAATEVYRRASHRWMALQSDLDELAQFKERAATCALLDRHAEFVPAVSALRAKAQASLADANERLAFIAARSTRDVETGVVVVAPQFAAENAQRLAQRDKAERDLAKVRRLLAQVAAEVQTRVAHERLRGRAGLPSLRLLSLANVSHTGLIERISDDHVSARIAELQSSLGVRLT